MAERKEYMLERIHYNIVGSIQAGVQDAERTSKKNSSLFTKMLVSFSLDIIAKLSNAQAMSHKLGLANRAKAKST